MTVVAVTTCCDLPLVVPSLPNSGRVQNDDVRGSVVVQLPVEICIACGSFTSVADGSRLRLIPEELEQRSARWFARIHARKSVLDAFPVSEVETAATFPDPFSLPLFACTAQVGVPALLAYDDGAMDVREALRAAVGMPAGKNRETISTPVGEVFVDSVYLDHIHEIDDETGKSRIDHDHVSFATLIRTTLERPLEVFKQQPGNAKTRRTIFVALYQIDSSYSYHTVIVTRRHQVLTSFRLNGGTAAFKKMRFGIPLHVAY